MSELLKSLYEKTKSAASTVDKAVTGAKRKFTDALVEATDLTPPSMRTGDLYQQQKQERKDVTGTLFDVATPDASMLAGKFLKMGKLAKMANRPDAVSNIVGAASKGNTAFGKVTQKDTAQNKWEDKINAEGLKGAYENQLKKAVDEAGKLVQSGSSKLDVLNKVSAKYFQNDKLGNPKNDLVQAIFGKK
jgi:hypothetical protein